MNENSICLKKIGDFLEEPNNRFLVKSYQRGYKWTEKEVTDLLEDINEFIPKDIIPKPDSGRTKTFYCLQPVVVKKEENGQWELIDGQQRLTTIYIILSVLKEQNPDLVNRTYAIDYQTRKSSADFLKNICSLNSEIVRPNNSAKTDDIWASYLEKTANKKVDNIDNYHFFSAYCEVKKWFSDKNEEIAKVFYEKLTSHTEVIWYNASNTTEGKEIRSEEIFARLNSGKIPLTNAELIKALFLQQSNFTGSDPKAQQLKQTEIAQEWDRMEYALQNEQLWYFLNKQENDKPTRIEFLFDLKSNKAQDEKSIKDEFHSFRYFAGIKAAKGIAGLDENWQEIKNLFQTLEEWFDDPELYHYVGYLVNFGKSINSLVALSNGKTKTAFKNALKLACKLNCGIDDLRYDSNRGNVKKALLLFNIETILQSNRQNTQQKILSIRFPFDVFKKDNWDIEHIHAIASEMPGSKEHLQTWFRESEELLMGLKEDLDKKKNAFELISCIQKLQWDNFKADTQSFQDTYSAVVSFFNENIEEPNDIDNLALLDAGTNRSYKNALFPIKRKKIIAQDKQGKFIPICTKNAFLKYYTESPSHLHFWSENDRTGYRNQIEKTLKFYLNPINN